MPSCAQKTQTAKRTIAILGSTGSIGTQTIDLISRHPEKYEVLALTANKSVDRLAEQARQLNAGLAVIADETKYRALKDALAGTGIKVAAGAKAVEEVGAMESDWLMSGIVGAAGLPGTLAAARRGGTIAFANKETLVCAGPLMMEMVAKAGATLLPVDSEHNAIFQVFDREHHDGIARLILTASGGPFRKLSREEMAKVTAEQAVKHPVWSMGAKISIDSATLMNKALEVIEASLLFQMPREQISVLVHPQSVVHSMVEYRDGSVLAQLGSPDMRTPIGFCLAWPERMETPVPKLDLARVAQLTFENPDPIKFPALQYAQEAMMKGGIAPASMSAANEVAVQAFIDKRIGFLDIERIVGKVLNATPKSTLTDLDVLREADAAARAKANEMIGS
ncbi:MAG: 1-deoxy-D-xylulose-5-phosphate reductoisomerase [Alphaproteobacteria bacterium]|nr:1-deoxy-D-xylulose-5-phosphate reductoisomerase [Alphaproteobacteria bacterium]